MKKSAVVLTGILLLAGAVSAWAQAPFAGYKAEAKTETYHSLSNDATVLWQPAATDTLNHKMLLSASERIALSATGVAKYPAGIALGSQMPFGLKKFSSLAMTADGYVFFGSRIKGSDAADSVLATANSVDNLDITQTMVSVDPGKCEYFLYSGFLTDNAKPISQYIAAWLVGGQNAKIGYETVDGVLYIGYENIRLCDFRGNQVTVSWNYQLDLASGNINLQIKDFSNATSNQFKYLFGLFGSQKDFFSFDALWLKDWTGEIVNYAWEDNAFSTEGEPADKTFSFTVPAACQKITDFTVTWDNSNTATDNSINIGSAIDWSKGNKALFILSQEQTLSDSNLPVDGTLYIDGNKIGTGEVRVGTKDNLGGDVDGLFENLESSTTYYCHVFAYSDTCSGLIYSDPQTKSFTTLMGAPQTDVITMGLVSETSFKMSLATPVSSELTYVVAVSKDPLSDEYGNPLVELTNGTTYQAGTIVDGATIKNVGIGAGEITIDGLDAATPYYVAVWHMQGTGSSVEYSLKYTTVGQRTITKIPVTIDFADELTESQPRGWTISKDEAGVYGFTVSNYGSADDDGPGIAVAAMAKAPQKDSKILVCHLMYDPEEDNDLPQTKTMSAYAISPVFDTAAFPNVTGIFKVGFLSTSWGGFGGAYTLQGSDSVVISWAANQSDNWNRLYKIDRTTEFDEDGFATITTASIRPNGNFRYKVEVFRTLRKNEETAEAFVIESVEMEEDLPCKYPTDIQVVESDLYATSAKLQWEDANRPYTPSFALAYRALGEEEWNEKTTGNVELLLENLKPATTYDVRIQAVCGEDDASLVKTISFTTYGVIPYIWDPEALMEENPEEDLEFPAEMKVYRGALDATLQLGAGWDISTDRKGYPMLNLPLATEANTWLMLPALIAANNGEISATVNLANWGMKMIDNEQVYMDPQSQDTLWLFISENGSFAAADRRVAGFVALKDLLYAVDTTEEDGIKSYRQRFNEKTFEFSAVSGKKYSLAFFIPGIGADVTTNEPNANNLSINKISVEYGTIIYPAVTDIYTYDLSKTGVSIAWQGNADSYEVIYKPRSEEVFDTVDTEATHIDLTDLQPGTRYEFYVYGIYNGISGEKSEQRFFSTLAICETPTNFDIVQTFWDGARITAQSKNTRLVYIKSEGAVSDAYINQLLEWTYRGDSLRIRGLHVGGVGYPYSVKVRAVCSPGDSSAWTETKTFQTASYPEIGTPTDLRARFNTSNRTATLSWTPGVNNDFMYIYYKKATVRDYDTTGTENTSYILRNLENDVVYNWVLQPLHDYLLLGSRTEVAEFGSNVGNERGEYAEAVRVRVNDRRIIVDNPENRYIKVINVYDMAGRCLKSYPVNDRGNLFVNTDLKQGAVLIEVIGSANERVVSKAVIR